MESLLRPREIQARIRSGQTPETVADAAQTSVEQIMAFATPVLAERAFVAQQAAKASVRRRAGEGAVGSLADAVASRLEPAGTDPGSVDWDAWRREDGRWTVVAQYVDSGGDTSPRRAEFTYDAVGRYVTAEDDLARWLVGERRAAAPAQDRWQPEDQGHEAEQLALGDDALRVVTGRVVTGRAVTGRAVTGRSLAAVTDLASPADALEHVEPSSREAPQRLWAVELPVTAEEATADLTEAARAVRATDHTPDRTPDRTPAQTPDQSATEPAPERSASAGGDALFEDAGLRTGPEVLSERRQATTTGRPRSRRSMPSWDDIMLGSAPRGE